MPIKYAVSFMLLIAITAGFISGKHPLEAGASEHGLLDRKSGQALTEVHERLINESFTKNAELGDVGHKDDDKHIASIEEEDDSIFLLFNY